MSNVLTNVSQAVAAKLPSKSALKEIAKYNRRINNVAPPNPETAEELTIPDDYASFSNGRFLLGDSFDNENGNRILIFGKESNVNWSGQMKKVFVDGTFRQAPQLFSQIYVIMSARETASSNLFVFPVMYALLPNKQEQTYVRLFAMIKEVFYVTILQKFFF